jgi:hypothetical protein
MVLDLVNRPFIHINDRVPDYQEPWPEGSFTDQIDAEVITMIGNKQ